VDADLERLTRLAKAVRIELGELGNALVHSEFPNFPVCGDQRPHTSKRSNKMAVAESHAQPQEAKARRLDLLADSSSMKRASGEIGTGRCNASFLLLSRSPSRLSRATSKIHGLAPPLGLTGPLCYESSRENRLRHSAHDAPQLWGRRALSPVRRTRFEVLHLGRLHRCAKSLHGKGSTRGHTSTGLAVRTCGLRAVRPRAIWSLVRPSSTLPVKPVSRTL
jgi:hypothetical protein